MRVYIAGPMTGRPAWNRAAFDIEETRLVGLGHTVVNPAACDPRHDGPCTEGTVIGAEDVAGNRHPYGCWMRTSLTAMLTCRHVVMLPGWRQSPGASLEHQIAHATGMTIEYRGEE